MSSLAEASKLARDVNLSYGSNSETVLKSEQAGMVKNFIYKIVTKVTIFLVSREGDRFTQFVVCLLTV